MRTAIQRRTAAVAVALALLLPASELLHGLHYVAVQHTICPEHGELLHGPQQGEPLHQPHACGSGYRKNAAPHPKPPHHEGHCAVATLQPPPTVGSATEAVSAVPSATPQQASRTLQFVLRRWFRVAPKNSPPSPSIA